MTSGSPPATPPSLPDIFSVRAHCLVLSAHATNSAIDDRVSHHRQSPCSNLASRQGRGTSHGASSPHSRTGSPHVVVMVLSVDTTRSRCASRGKLSTPATSKSFTVASRILTSRRAQPRQHCPSLVAAAEPDPSDRLREGRLRGTRTPDRFSSPRRREERQPGKQSSPDIIRN